MRKENIFFFLRKCSSCQVISRCRNFSYDIQMMVFASLCVKCNTAISSCGIDGPGLTFQMVPPHQKGKKEPRLHERPRKLHQKTYWEVRFILTDCLMIISLPIHKSYGSMPEFRHENCCLWLENSPQFSNKFSHRNHWITMWSVWSDVKDVKCINSYVPLFNEGNPESVVRHVVVSPQGFVPIGPAAIVPIASIANFNPAALLPPAGGKYNCHWLYFITMSSIDVTHTKNVHREQFLTGLHLYE